MDMGQLRDCSETKKRQIPSIEVQNSLKDEILQLHKQLENQFLVRSALEKALSFRPLVHDPTNDSSITKPTKDLIKEISVLEMEVVYLEKYLLSMYRRTFDERASSLSSLDERSKSNLATNGCAFSQIYGNNFTSKKKISAINSSSSMPTQDPIEKPKEHIGVFGSQVIVDSSIHRSHSSLSQRSARSFRTSLPLGTLAETAHLYHSLPLSMLECAEGDTSSVTLAEHLGTSMSKHDWETPNWLSEEMIKCISAIYCQLADPPFLNQDFPSSPISCSSSMSESSPRAQYETWSPPHGESSSFNSWMNNPFLSQGSKEFTGSYFTMVEVLGICRESQSLRGVEHMLQKFRSLVSRLEEVDPRKMKHEEKLAFWINVHNALVMHAFIVYGIPQSNQKRISLLLKAAYIVGGQSISVDLIQSSILGCRLPRPGQWFQFLFSKPKFKGGDARKSYAMEHPQPLLKFALCSGNHSDPPVRIYTPKRVYQELEMAKEEYIQSNLKVHKENKILLPKIVESYSKELGLCSAALFEMIEYCWPDCLRKSFQQGKLGKKMDWIPHDFNFRFLLSRELAK